MNLVDDGWVDIVDVEDEGWMRVDVGWLDILDVEGRELVRVE